MRAIFVGFDSLNRNYLPSYGGLEAAAPNFARLAGRTAQFQNSYVCSMPCMPARRELHTGRPNFLHRGWGPIEPFDDSVPQMLKRAGVYTHLATDHFHYFEDGGCTYHTRYSSWEVFRGQEGDPWFPHVGEMPWPEHAQGRNAGRDDYLRSNYANRMAFRDGAPLPTTLTFDAGLRFLEHNHAEDNWLLQIETFSPHEPFVSDETIRNTTAGTTPEEPLFDWPHYKEVTETRDHVEICRKAYLDSLKMCDDNLGKVLDAMDAHDMWADTMLIVWTDHGFFLGERGLWAKTHMPWWNHLANTPFFVWDPRSPEAAGVQRQALVQPSLDIPVTLLNFFGQQPTADMMGHDLAPVVANDTPVRECGIYGTFGGHVNVTDGRYVYMRATARPEVRLYEYTYMPTRMNAPMGVEALRDNVAIAPPFSFTKDCSPMRVGNPAPELTPEELEARRSGNQKWNRNMLYDLESDPTQEHPLDDPATEDRMLGLLRQQLHACDAPAEQFARLGL